MINRAILELTSTGDHLIHHPAPFKESHSSPPPPPSPSLSLIPSFRLSLPWRFHDGSSSPIVSHHEGRQLYFPVSRSELVWIMCECSLSCLLFTMNACSTFSSSSSKFHQVTRITAKNRHRFSKSWASGTGSCDHKAPNQKLGLVSHKVEIHTLVHTVYRPSLVI